MPISEDDRNLALNTSAELLDLRDEQRREAAKVKLKYTDLPDEIYEYVDASTMVISKLIDVLIDGQEKIFLLDDALMREMQKRG